MTTHTPPPSTRHRRPAPLPRADRVALTALWATPPAIAAWGWSALPTNDPAGAPTAASMTSHLAVTLTVAAIAAVGVVVAVIATREARIYRADPDTDFLERQGVPLPVLIVLGTAAYAGYAVVMLLSLYSGLFPPTDMPPQPI